MYMREGGGEGTDSLNVHVNKSIKARQSKAMYMYMYIGKF